jgi:hypothetical protein
MLQGDHKGLPYATAGPLILLARVNGNSASLSRRHLSLP